MTSSVRSDYMRPLQPRNRPAKQIIRGRRDEWTQERKLILSELKKTKIDSEPALTAVLFRFPFPGPWGEGMTEHARGLAGDIASEPGLIWKIWLENRESGHAGGIYLFDGAAAAERYREKHERRLAAIAPWLEDGVLPSHRIVEALETLIQPGDRVALEGDNQKQADFLSRSLAKVDPQKLHDVHLLADALIAWYGGSGDLLDSYSADCLRRVWRAEHFSWWMTTMLHNAPGADDFDRRLQLSQLRYVTTSQAAALGLAENYVGLQRV